MPHFCQEYAPSLQTNWVQDCNFDFPETLVISSQDGQLGTATIRRWGEAVNHQVRLIRRRE